MVLIFGGTTEGKKVAEMFDVIGQDYFYSTKTDAHKSVKGKRVYGEMELQKMKSFCSTNNVRLIIDAAHPFAIHLHQNIYTLATEMKIDVIRYERNFPELKETNLLKYFNSYEELIIELAASEYQNILALTGVQTISKFESIWNNRNCYFRILNSELSKEKARETGIASKYRIPMQPKANTKELAELSEKINAEILLSKESGESGFFETKVQVSQLLRIPLWVVKKPILPTFKNVVNKPKLFLQLFYCIKKTALKVKGELRSGYTTGTCVTAAAKGCFIALAEKKFPRVVEVELPDGEKTSYSIFPKSISENSATCVVIKDAGDDPDITHSKEIGCELIISKKSGIHFLRGEGIGLVTLPGLQVNVGDPAINPVPRKMISDMLYTLAEEYELECDFEVKPFVPEGKELTKQTFNPRIGVIGGISIIGTSGKVMPYSNEAFLASICQQIKVARQNGCNEVVLTSGKRSENRLKSRFPNLTSVAFVHFGNLVGETIKLAVEEGIEKINLAIMFGKAIKLAEGHLDTHSKRVVFNPRFAAKIARQAGHSNTVSEQIKSLTLANAIVDFIPFSEQEPFYKLVAHKCHENCQSLFLKENYLTLFLLVGDDGKVEVQL